MIIKRKLLLRIVVSPFILGLILTTYTYHAIKNTILFVLYAREWITYSKDDKKTIQDIYLLLKEEKLK